MLKKWIKKVLVVIVLLSVFVGQTNITSFAQIGSKDNAKERQINNAWDGITRENSYEGNGFKITYKLQNFWNGGYNAIVKIENVGDKVIDNWTLGFDYQGEIASVWNAEIKTCIEGKCVVKNAGWNQDIETGQSVEFGINGKGDFVGFPYDYQLLGEISSVSIHDYTIDYEVINDWGNGFNANIIITNNTDRDFVDWVLEFDYDRNINEIWDATIELHEGNHYVIKNSLYNSVITANSSVSFGFIGKDGDTTVVPQNYNLSSFEYGIENLEDIKITIEDDRMQFCESESGDYYFVKDEIKSLSGKAINIQNVDSFSYTISDGTGEILYGKLEKEENWTITNFGLGYGYNLLAFTVKSQGVEKRINFNIVNTCIGNMNNAGIDYDTDTDGDGVSDYLETKYGTDIYNIDTDGDGLDDYMEILIPNLSPTEIDGDLNGILDRDEDYDNDGLSNYDEINIYKTDYSSVDTDNDLLSDYDEIEIYGTNPKKADTDDDGVSDYDEIKIGSDPLVFETTFRKEIRLDADDNYSTSVKVTVDNLLANQVSSFEIGRSTDTFLTDKEIPGYIDDGYNFVIEGEITGATVEVSYDRTLEDKEFDPALYYFNEENQLLELVDNQINENGKVIAHLEHFSKYILINKTEYVKNWNYTFLQMDDKNKFSGLDIAFLIDDSGSMLWNDTNDDRGAVTRGFIDKLADNDRASIISFNNYANTLSGFTSDKDTLMDSTYKLYSRGGTNLSSGISQALKLFNLLENDQTRLKYIVMLTDGDGTYDSNYTKLALDNNIIIDTIGLGSSVSSSVLSAMAETTGGQYYHINNAEELYYIFDTIAEKSDYYKDSDNDGISDYYEKEMAAGHLVLGNGVPLTSVSYLNKDSDGDGLSDGEEISIIKLGPLVYVKMVSNPGLVDSDGDGINDKDDQFPLVKQKSQTQVLYQTVNKEGISKLLREDYVADDLTFNDRSFTQIVSDCKLVGVVVGITPEFIMWAKLADLFLLGVKDRDLDLEVTLVDLYDEFRYRSNNEGRSAYVGSKYEPSYYHKYTNDVLTDRVRNASAMDSYIKDVKNIIVKKLKAYDGDLSAIAIKENGGVVSNEINSTLKLPVLELGESVALTLAIHDFQGHTVTVDNFVCNGNSFSGTIKFHFYDHFGLDNDDYQYIPGFSDWYTLQHYDKFNGKYCPFITVVDMSCDFSGTF